MHFTQEYFLTASRSPNCKQAHCWIVAYDFVPKMANSNQKVNNTIGSEELTLVSIRAKREIFGNKALGFENLKTRALERGQDPQQNRSTILPSGALYQIISEEITPDYYPFLLWQVL